MSDDDDDDIHQSRLDKLTAGGNGRGPGNRRGYLSLIEQPPTPMTDLGKLRSVKVQEAEDGAPSSPPVSASDDRESKRRRQTKEETLENLGKVHQLLFGSKIQRPQEVIEAVRVAVTMRPPLISPMTSPSRKLCGADSVGGEAVEGLLKVDQPDQKLQAGGSTPEAGVGGHRSAHEKNLDGAGGSDQKRQRIDASSPDDADGGRRDRRSGSRVGDKITGETSVNRDGGGEAHDSRDREFFKDRDLGRETNGGVNGGSVREGGHEKRKSDSPSLHSPPEYSSKDGSKPGNAVMSPAGKKEHGVPAYPTAKTGSVLDEGRALKTEAEQCKRQDPFRASRLYFKSSIKFLESASEEDNTPPQRPSHVGFEQVSKMFHYTAVLTNTWLKREGKNGDPDTVRAVRETEAISLKAAAMCLMRNYQVVSKKRLKESIKEVTKDAKEGSRYFGGADCHPNNPTPPDSATSDGFDGNNTSVSPVVGNSSGGSAKDQLVKDAQELMQCLDYWTMGCEKASSIRNSKLGPLQDIQMTQPARLVQYLKDFADKSFV